MSHLNAPGGDYSFGLVYWSQPRTVKDTCRRAQSLQTAYNHNTHSQPQHVGLISIFPARTDYQWDFTFCFDIEGCLWSRQSTRAERTEQRRVRPHASHADVFSFFFFFLFSFSLSTFFKDLFSSVSDLGSTRGNEFSSEVKFEMCGTELLMHFCVASTMNRSRWRVCTNLFLIFSATGLVLGCHFWFGVKHI